MLKRMSRIQKNRKMIVLAEYLNYVNDKNEPKGHGKKSLEEAYNLLKDSGNQIKCMGSPEYIDFIEDYKCVESMERKKSNRLRRLMRAKKNIKKALREGEMEIVWFTCSDWMLFFILPFIKVRGSVVATVYRDILADLEEPKWFFFRTIMRRIVRKGMNRLDLAFITNPSFDPPYVKKKIHIPDFYFDETYADYLKYNKEENVICLGLMHRDKNLKQLVRHFNGSEIQLYIIGDFEDNALFEEISEIACDNVTIENKRVNDREYKKLIGENKWIVLPYSESYRNATSGILLETIYMGSTIIAPKFLLENNRINGIGYSSISEIPTSYKELNEVSKQINNNLSQYGFGIVSKKVRDSLRLLEC